MPPMLAGAWSLSRKHPRIRGVLASIFPLIHNWVNRGTEPCVIAFVLIAAKSATAGGRVLGAQG